MAATKNTRKRTAPKQGKQAKAATKRAKVEHNPNVVKLIPDAVAAGKTLVGFEREHGERQLWKLWYAEELRQNPTLAIKATPVALANARKGTAKKPGLRWNRIAVYSGLSVAEVVKRVASKDASLLTSYTGRGTKRLGAGAASTK